MLVNVFSSYFEAILKHFSSPDLSHLRCAGARAVAKLLLLSKPVLLNLGTQNMYTPVPQFPLSLPLKNALIKSSCKLEQGVVARGR